SSVLERRPAAAAGPPPPGPCADRRWGRRHLWTAAAVGKLAGPLHRRGARLHPGGRLVTGVLPGQSSLRTLRSAAPAFLRPRLSLLPLRAELERDGGDERGRRGGRRRYRSGSRGHRA
ncbi:conserved hypothetical protein, partial [Ricinus communis]